MSRSLYFMRLTPFIRCMYVGTHTFDPLPMPGYCVDNGNDQNNGVIKVNSLDGSTKQAQDICLAACKAKPDATGCEIVWGHSNQGCYIMTETITSGNGVNNHLCWVFDQGFPQLW